MRTGADQEVPSLRLAQSELNVEISPTNQAITASPFTATATCGAYEPAATSTWGVAREPAGPDSAAVARRPATLSDWLNASAAHAVGRDGHSLVRIEHTVQHIDPEAISSSAKSIRFARSSRGECRARINGVLYAVAAHRSRLR